VGQRYGALRAEAESSFTGLSSDGLIRVLGKQAGRLPREAGAPPARAAYGEGDLVTCVADLDAGLLVFLINGAPFQPRNLAVSPVARSQALHLFGLAAAGGGGSSGEQRDAARDAGTHGDAALDAETERQVRVSCKGWRVEGRLLQCVGRSAIRAQAAAECFLRCEAYSLLCAACRMQGVSLQQQVACITCCWLPAAASLAAGSCKRWDARRACTS